MKREFENPNYPHLTREEASRIISASEDDFAAVEGLAQALVDMSSSDAMPAEQGHGVYRVAMAIKRQSDVLKEVFSQLFHGLHANAKPPEIKQQKTT